MIRDPFTDQINTTNTARWIEQAGSNRCRLALTLGIVPDGSVHMYRALDLPPAELVKMLRACADAMEAQQSASNVILPG